MLFNRSRGPKFSLVFCCAVYMMEKESGATDEETDPKRLGRTSSAGSSSENEDDAPGSSDEEADDDEITFQSLENKIRLRAELENSNLPATVTVLECISFGEERDKNGVDDMSPWTYGTVYLVGTAHFSVESQNDVIDTIHRTQPDVVMVELCSNRVAILSMDEQKLLEEAKQLNLEKIMATIRQSGVVQGVLHCMLLSMSAHVTKQLGMAPGGEFRAAFREFQKVPDCKMHLGDRPIHITLQRAFGSLSWWQKTRLFAGLLWSHGAKVTKEDIEKAKRKDLLEEILREMAGEFPDLSRIFVDERDQFMAHVLRSIAQNVRSKRRARLIAENKPIGDLKRYPVVIVGVVGMGHVPGIVANWNKCTDIQKLMQVPERSKWPAYVKLGMKGALLGLACFLVVKSGVKLYYLFI